MAILVLIDRDATHENAEKDARGCYKRGDIVAVHEDSAHDGDLVRNPISAPWVLIKIAGVTKAQVERAIEPEFDADGQDAKIITRRKFRKIITRRKFRLNPADLPAGVRQTIARDRYYETTLAQVRNFIKNKRTGVAF